MGTYQSDTIARTVRLIFTGIIRWEMQRQHNMVSTNTVITLLGKELCVNKKKVTEKGPCIWTEIWTEDWKQWKYTDVVKMTA